MKEVERILFSKTVEYDEEFQKFRRMKEDFNILSKKVDKQKKLPTLLKDFLSRGI